MCSFLILNIQNQIYPDVPSLYTIFFYTSKLACDFVPSYLGLNYQYPCQLSYYDSYIVWYIPILYYYFTLLSYYLKKPQHLFKKIESYYATKAVILFNFE